MVGSSFAAVVCFISGSLGASTWANSEEGTDTDSSIVVEMCVRVSVELVFLISDDITLWVGSIADVVLDHCGSEGAQPDGLDLPPSALETG